MRLEFNMSIPINRKFIVDNLICEIKNKLVILHTLFRDVAQSGLEYASGGRGVGSSNLLIPTKENQALTFVGVLFLCNT
jgi:hypothetical protein